MKDLSAIEEGLGALEQALARARHNAAVGHGPPDLPSLFAAQEEATHPDTAAAIGEVLAQGGTGAPGATRLLALHLDLVVQKAQAGLESRILAAEETARAGDRLLREAEARMRSEPAAGRRRAVESEWLAAQEDLQGLRADRVERFREALAVGPSAADTVDAAGLAEAELKRTADPYAEVLAWAARKYVEDAPPPAGELSSADVTWLASGQAEGGAFAPGALRLTAGAVCEGMGLPLRGRGVRLDLERRPGKRVGAHAARISAEVVAAAALPTGTPRDLADALEALGRATLLAGGPPPGSDPTLPLALGLLLSRTILEPPFHLRILKASTAETARSVRLLALGELGATREDCARLLVEREIVSGGTGKARLRSCAALLGHARRAVTDDREPLVHLGLPGEGARLLTARSLAGFLAAQLTLRFDEDWFRNPRSGPFLMDLLDPARTASEIAGELGGSLDPALASARPLQLLDKT